MPDFFFRFRQGEVKPIVIEAKSSTGSALTVATCTLVDHKTKANVGMPDQPMTVQGAEATSPAFVWTTLGWFTLQITLDFADGIVDRSNTANIQILPVPN